MEGSHSLQDDQGGVEKTADEQGLIRGVEQSKVEADGGAIIGRCMAIAQRELQGPASTMAGVLQGSTGLGNACCGVLLL